jgi:hypothetical protein
MSRAHDTPAGMCILTTDEGIYHVMRGPSGTHILLAAETDDARLAAHWDGFVAVNLALPPSPSPGDVIRVRGLTKAEHAWVMFALGHSALQAGASWVETTRHHLDVAATTLGADEGLVALTIEDNEEAATVGEQGMPAALSRRNAERSRKCVLAAWFKVRAALGE